MHRFRLFIFQYYWGNTQKLHTYNAIKKLFNNVVCIKSLFSAGDIIDKKKK